MDALIITGGEGPALPILEILASEADFIVAADSGLEALAGTSFSPDYIVGDGGRGGEAGSHSRNSLSFQAGKPTPGLARQVRILVLPSSRKAWQVQDCARGDSIYFPAHGSFGRHGKQGAQMAFGGPSLEGGRLWDQQCGLGGRAFCEGGELSSPSRPSLGSRMHP
ncbi:MAG: hypothetical protein FD137_973 [Spirochaetes bacterium]|nr:MAG: hypothetical protein FD137_973 [Spirochaetota bacterium]